MLNSLDSSWMRTSIEIDDNSKKFIIADLNNQPIEIWYNYVFRTHDLIDKIPEGILTITYPENFKYANSQEFIERLWNIPNRDPKLPKIISIADNNFYAATWSSEKNGWEKQLLLSDYGSNYKLFHFDNINCSNDEKLKSELLEICEIETKEILGK